MEIPEIRRVARYLLPDYHRALAQGSPFLGLAPPCDLYEAIAFLLSMYLQVPSITGYPVYLGDVDSLLTGTANTTVLRSLDRLAAAAELVEVRLLVVPGHNDGADALRRTGAYLAQHAPGVPVRVIGFRPHGVRAAARDIPEPTAEQRAAYAGWVREGLGTDLVTVT